MNGVSVVNRDHKKDEFISKVKITVGSAVVLGALFSAYVPLNDRYMHSPDRPRYELVRNSDKRIRDLVSTLSEQSIGSLDVRNPDSHFSKTLDSISEDLTRSGHPSLASKILTCVSTDSNTTSNCLVGISHSVESELRSAFKGIHDLDLCVSLIKSLASIAGLFFVFGAAGLISDRFPSKPSEKYGSRINSDGA